MDFIEIKGLRYDNIIEIYTPDGWQQARVYGFDRNGLTTRIDGDKFAQKSALECRTIKLTDEWIEKLGFKSRGPAPKLFFFPSDKRFSIGSIDPDVYAVMFLDYEFAYINYVHQLQNLYFALKGLELIIK